MKQGKGQNLLTLFLGVLWLIDGVLQLQPLMFTQSFVSSVLRPNLIGQPSVMVVLIKLGISAFSSHIVLANLFFASMQLVIGLILIFVTSWRWKKSILWVSLFWCLIVWIFGEGVGNLFTDSASFYTGAPGSVLLYFILTLSLLFPDFLPISFLPRLGGFIFYLGGILNTLPMFWVKGMQNMFWQMSSEDKIEFIAFPAKHVLSVYTATSTVNIIAVSLLLILGIWLIVRPGKIIGLIAFIFLLSVWWISQDFGGILTFPFGTATDPNSAPLFMLFLLPIFTNHQEKGKLFDTKFSLLIVATLLLIGFFSGIILSHTGNGHIMHMR